MAKGKLIPLTGKTIVLEVLFDKKESNCSTIGKIVYQRTLGELSIGSVTVSTVLRRLRKEGLIVLIREEKTNHGGYHMCFYKLTNLGRETVLENRRIIKNLFNFKQSTELMLLNSLE